MNRQRILLSLLGLLVVAHSSLAAPRQEMVGARAIGMGGAFSAVASDASVAHWNPAALASLQRQEIGLAYADRFGLGLNHSYLNYVLPVGDHHALGIDWLHLGFDDSELSTGQNKLSFAYGYRNGIEFLRPFIGNTAIGVSGKYRSFNVDLDGNNLGSASGWGFDLGLLAPLPYGLRLAVVAQDLGGSCSCLVLIWLFFHKIDLVHE